MNVNLEGIPAMLRQVTFASLLPALLYLIAGLVIIRLIMHAAQKTLNGTKIEKTLHKFLLTLIKLVLYFLLFMTVAGALGIQITSFVAVLSVAGLAISLSLQGVMGNLASGITLLTVKPFRAGDYVEINGVSGTVTEIGFIYTKVTEVDNIIVYIPNSEVCGNKITNFTAEGLRRVDLVFPASYDSPQTAVKAALAEAVSTPMTLSSPAPFIRVSAYKDNIEYTVRVWCKTEDYWNLYFDIIEAVPECYKKHGAAFAYPHLNVHLAKEQ